MDTDQQTNADHIKIAETLRERLDFEKLLNEVTKMAFVVDDLGEFYDHCLALTGEKLKVDRAYFFKHNEATNTMDNTHEWCAEGISPQKDRLQGIPGKDLPWWVDTLRRNEIICYSDIESITDETAKEILRSQGIKSILIVPLFVNGQYYGFFGVDDCANYRNWIQDYVDILLSFSRIVTMVTERKLAEKLLKVERQQLLSIFNSIEEIIYITDPVTYEILFVNNFFKKKLGKNLKEKKCYELFQGLQAPCEFCTNNIILHNKGEVYRWEYYNPFLKKHLLLFDRIIKWPDGRDVRFEMAIDITDHKQAEEALKSNYALLHIAGETARLGGWDVDLEKYISNWSDTVADIHEMPHGFAPPVEEGINFYAPEWRDRITRVFNDCAQKGIPYDEEMEIITSKGKRVWIRTIGEALKDENGKIIKVHGSFQDISERKQAEETLRKSEEKYRRITENMSDVVWITDAELNTIYVSPSIEKLTGETADEHLNKSLEKRLPPESLNTILQIFQEEMEKEKDPLSDKSRTREFELQHYKADGNTIWVSMHISALRDDIGNIIGYQGVTRNISDRKHAEEALRKSENLFKKVFEILPIGLWLADKNGRLMQGNPAGVEIWGMEPKVDQSQYGVFKAKRLPSGEEIAPEDWALAHTVNKGMTIVDELLEIDAFDGKKKIILNYTAPILDSNGGLEGAIVVNQDITDRQKSQEALKRIEWMLSKDAGALINDQAPPYGDLSELSTCRLILDAVGKNVLEDIADDYLSLLGTSSAIYEKNGDYALGIFASNWCQYMDQASRKLCNTDDNKEALNCGKWLCHDCCWEEASQQAMESGQAVDIECKGGIHLYALPIVAGNEVVGAINLGYGDPPQDKAKIIELAEKYSVPSDELMKKAKEYESRPPYIIDMAKKRLQASANLIGEIVSRKLAEEEILKLNEELEQRVIDRTAQLEESNKELEAFSYSVSHDLRAPLRHINGYINLLNEDFRSDLPQKAQYYLSTVTNAARQMGRLIDDLLQFSRTGRQELRKTKIAMNLMVKEVLENIKQSLDKRAITWKIQELPEVFGDYSLLKQVWFNLIDNAVKYSSNTLKAEISIGFDEAEKDFVFYIRDNGAGFDMNYAHKLFGVFERLHSSAEFEGTGIGLATVQRIIQKHHGRVWAEGEPNKGATFFFSLPKSRKD